MSMIVVTSADNSGTGTLRAAIASAAAGDTIVFNGDLAGTDIKLLSPLVIDTSITIDGSAASGISIDGNNVVTDFDITASDVAIENLSIINGNGVGTNGTTSFDKASLSIYAGNAGGGIFLTGNFLTLEHDYFADDTATGGQGGTYIAASFAYHPPGGSAAGAVYVENNATITAVALSFFNNAATPGQSSAAFGGTPGSAYPNSNDSVVAAACYCSGSLVLTECGEVPVDRLTIRDRVITKSGEHRPIKWIGRRCYLGRFLAANPKVQPIRFRTGSLGGGLPRRDLLVSPEHAMFLGGILIPARCLVNGSSVVQERKLDRVEYFHVELDSHDVLLVEGAPSESFMDDDSRGVFHNASEFAALYPYAPEPTGYCARRVESGFELDAIRRRLAKVAKALAPLTASRHQHRSGAGTLRTAC